MTLTQEANNRIVLTLSNEIHAKDTQVEAAVNLLIRERRFLSLRVTGKR